MILKAFWAWNVSQNWIIENAAIARLAWLGSKHEAVLKELPFQLWDFQAPKCT